MPKGKYRFSQIKPSSTSSSKTGTETEYKKDKRSADDSDYESEGGTHYSPKAFLGEGVSARARMFESIDGEKLVVLDPRCKESDDNEREVRRKYRFFAQQYPERKRDLFEQFVEKESGKKSLYSYRLIVPFISGVTYRQYAYTFGKIKDIEQQIHFFLSVIEAFKTLHANNLIYVDFKNDNILYDAQMKRSFLIDGGTSSKKGHPISSIFSVNNNALLEKKKYIHTHIAPECWTVKNSPQAIAHSSMDIFSIGAVLRDSFFETDLDADILALARTCRMAEPAARPTLDELAESLSDLLRERKYQGYAHFIHVIEEAKTNPLYSLIQKVAQHFLLDNKFRLHDRKHNVENESYVLSTLPESEQILFLEIAGHVLFSLAKLRETREFGLPEDYLVSMDVDTLMIRYKIGETVVRCNNGLEKKVVDFDKKSWKTNMVACKEAITSLVRMHPKLASYTYNFDKPVASACELWSILTQDLNSCLDLPLTTPASRGSSTSAHCEQADNASSLAASAGPVARSQEAAQKSDQNMIEDFPHESHCAIC